MKVQLLVSEWCASCHQAEKVWREVAEKKDFDFEVVDMGQPEGKAMVSQLRLKTIPALVMDNELKGIGVQTFAEALAWVKEAPDKAASTVKAVGLGLALANRLSLQSALFYLLLAGLSLPINGAFYGEGTARVIPLHAFTLGFLVFTIYGLADHMLPRFTGKPVLKGNWLKTQLVVAHLGLWTLAAGLYWSQQPVAVAGAALSWLALLIFAIRLVPLLKD